MTAHPIRRVVAVLAAATLTAALATSALAVDVEGAAKKPKPKCQGKVATIVGTKKADILKGTAKRDVIVARGGADRIYAKGGSDLICAGKGNDVVFGGPGADTIWGQLGRDTLNGNVGPDFLAGQIGNDIINGGIGVDTCFQGTGAGPVVRCERPAPPPVAPAPPPVPPAPPTLIPLRGILAVAFSDIDGLDGYSTGDIMIAQLVDTNGDGVPSGPSGGVPGDTIEMGRFPTTLTPTSTTDFADWWVKSHTVATIDQMGSGRLWVTTTINRKHGWSDAIDVQFYQEERGASVDLSAVQDGMAIAHNDFVLMNADSPSRPTVLPWLSTDRRDDDRLVDVELHWGGSIL